MGNKHWVEAPQKHEKYKWNIKQIFRDPAVSFYVYWRASMSVRIGDWEKWVVPSWTWNLTTRTKWFCSVQSYWNIAKTVFCKVTWNYGLQRGCFVLKKNCFSIPDVWLDGRSWNISLFYFTQMESLQQTSLCCYSRNDKWPSFLYSAVKDNIMDIK